MKTRMMKILLMSIVLSLSFVSCQDSNVVNSDNQVPRVDNVILMIGDGMSLPQIYGAMLAVDYPLEFMRFPVTGIVTTKSADKGITDSAAAGTAIATGEKTRNGMLGMTADSIAIPSMLEIFASQGKETGIVVTSHVVHATPAAFYGKNIKRSNYEDLAEQLVQDTSISLIMGGGRTYFTNRKDGKNLLQLMSEQGWNVYDTITDVDNAAGRIALIAAEKHLPDVEHRKDFLPQAVSIALDRLDKSSNGFFLMVEGSKIDMACHDNDSTQMVAEMLDFNQAIKVAYDYAQTHSNTLLIVTADHETGGLTFVDPQGKYTNITYNFSTSSHSALPVPIFAYGPRAELFSGWMYNTDIINKIFMATQQ